MRRRFYIILLLLLFPLLPVPAAAQEGLTMTVEPGFDSFFKERYWGVMRVTVANQGPALQAALQIEESAYQNNATLYTYPVDLPGQSRKQLTLNFPAPIGRRVTVDLVDGQGQTLLSDRVNVEVLSPDDFLAGVVAADPSLLNALAGLNTPAGERVAVAHLGLEDLPVAVQAWSALDLLVFNDVDTSQLSPAQLEALRTWVSQGGELVIGGGPNAAQTIAGLQPALPFAGVRLETLAHPLAGLEKFVLTSLPDRGPYVAAIPTEVSVAARVQEGDLPLIVSVRQGSGRIHYIALDLSLAPLDTLAGQPRFLPRLVDRLEPRFKPVAEQSNRDQMLSSLALLPERALPTPGTVALYLTIYVLAVGPVNYFILGRLKRREWSWITLPLIVLFFCGFGYFSGFRLRGNQPLVRQIALIRADAGASLASVDSFVGVYSPRRTTYRLVIDGPVLVRSLSTDSPGHNIRVVATDSTQVENLQADIGGMPALLARSQAAAPQIQANLSYNENNHHLEGLLLNGTGQPIQQAYLIIEDYVLEVGDLPPGETRVNDLARQQANYYSNFYDLTAAPADALEALELASRDMAIRAILNPTGYPYSSGGTAGSLPPGLYLTGWQAGSPLDIDLADHTGDRLSESLLLVNLPFSREGQRAEN